MLPRATLGYQRRRDGDPLLLLWSRWGPVDGTARLPSRVVPAPSTTITVQTRFADLDPLGHVNHVQFYVFMETARVRFMAQHGGTLRGHVLVARSECDHLREIPGTTDTVEVTVHVERIGTTSLVVHHELIDAGVRVAIGRTTMVAVGPDRRPRPVTDTERAHLLAGDQTSASSSTL